MSKHSKTPKGLLRGAKFNGRHSTVIPEATRVIAAAKRLPEVTKIILGYIVRPAGRTKPQLKFVEIPAGIRISVRGRSAQQTLIVYTSDRRQTLAVLEPIGDVL